MTINSSGIIKDFITLVSGTIVAQALHLIFSPVISRMYSPEQFGEFGIFFSIIATLAVIINGRYDLAIMIPKKDSSAINLAATAIVIAGLSALFIAFVLLFFDKDIIQLMKSHYHPMWLMIIPLYLIFMGIQKPLNLWLLRNKAYKKTATNKVIQSIGIVSITVLLGYISFEQGLIVGHLIGWVLFTLATVFYALKTKFDVKKVNKHTMAIEAKEHIEFPKHSLVPALLNTLASVMAVFFINKYFSTSEAGFYYNTRLYLLVPMSLITTTLSNIFLERFSEQRRENKPVKDTFIKTIKILSIVAIILVVILFFFGPVLFKFVFGDIWETAGVYSQILIFGYAMKFVASPMGIILHALNQVKLTMYFSGIYFVLMLGLFAFTSYPIRDFLILITLVEVVSYFIYLLIVNKAINRYELSLTATNE